jgi:hypothetical protein
MSTLQDTSQHRVRTRTRFGAGGFAITTLIAVGLAVLILAPTSAHKAVPHRPATAIHTQPISPADVTQPPTGCSRDPMTHALYCSSSAPAPFGIPTPPGYIRDPGTPELMRVTNMPDPAGHLPANHSHGRIIP